MCDKNKCGEVCERCAAARERMKIVDRSAKPKDRRSAELSQIVARDAEILRRLAE